MLEREREREKYGETNSQKAVSSSLTIGIPISNNAQHAEKNDKKHHSKHDQPSSRNKIKMEPEKLRTFCQTEDHNLGGTCPRALCSPYPVVRPTAAARSGSSTAEAIR